LAWSGLTYLDLRVHGWTAGTVLVDGWICDDKVIDDGVERGRFLLLQCSKFSVFFPLRGGGARGVGCCGRGAVVDR
jgi:hypothetical protein